MGERPPGLLEPGFHVVAEGWVDGGIEGSVELIRLPGFRVGCGGADGEGGAAGRVVDPVEVCPSPEDFLGKGESAVLHGFGLVE